MRLSIVTVCFNSEATIEQCIRSVLSQDYVDIEYIVIDGGSTDKTPEIVERYLSSISTFVSESDDGIYDAMNKGIRACTGDIIGILNSDDAYASNNEISEVVKSFELNPKAKIVLGNVQFINFDTGRIIRNYSAKRFRPYKLRFGWMPPHPASFIKRDIYENYGLYSLDFKISADYERFVHWIYVRRIEFAKLHRTIVNMRVGGASTAGFKSVYTLNKEIVRACKQNGLYTNIFLLLFKFPFKLLELLPHKHMRRIFKLHVKK